MQVDGGIVPVQEKEVLKVREKAVLALQAVFQKLQFPPIDDSEVSAAISAYNSQDIPDRDRVADIDAAQELLAGPLSVLDVIKALQESGYHEIAGNILELQRQRVVGDYLQPAAIFDENFKVKSVLTQPNDYQGPGTGYRVEGERWDRLQNLPQAWDPQTFRMEMDGEGAADWFEEQGPAQPGQNREIIIAVDPAFGSGITKSIGNLNLHDVILALKAGVQDEGVPVRIVRVFHTSDCAFIGHAGAQLSGSGIAIGIQSKGTTVIHQRDLAPLENLELFPQAPNLDLDIYRRIGRNAALYAIGKPVVPVSVKIDNTVRLRLIVQTTLLQCRATQMVVPDRPPEELRLRGRI
jgi:hypothetical protein